MKMDERALIMCIERQLGKRSVKTEDRFYEDLGTESIDMLHIIAEIESQTGIAVPEEMIPEFKTVLDLHHFIQNRQK
jgi:acyl carrier protein